MDKNTNSLENMKLEQNKTASDKVTVTSCACIHLARSDEMKAKSATEETNNILACSSHKILNQHVRKVFALISIVKPIIQAKKATIL